MSQVYLCPAAERVIQGLHLNEGEQLVVRSAVLRYIKPEGFGERLKWVVFRAWQAVKSIFGQSEWQKAEKVIKNKVAYLVGERPEASRLTGWGKDFVRYHLDLCLEMQEKKMADREAFTNLDVKNYIDLLAKKFQEHPAPTHENRLTAQFLEGMHYSEIASELRFSLLSQIGDAFNQPKKAVS